MQVKFPSKGMKKCCQNQDKRTATGSAAARLSEEGTSAKSGGASKHAASRLEQTLLTLTKQKTIPDLYLSHFISIHIVMHQEILSAFMFHLVSIDRNLLPSALCKAHRLQRTEQPIVSAARERNGLQAYRGGIIQH